MKALKLTISLITVMLIAVIFCGCSSTKVGTVFSTSYQIDLSGKNANSISKEIEEDFFDYESLFSPIIQTSDVSKINNATAGTPITVAKDTIELVKVSKEFFSLTEGQFNPSVYPLTRLWGFAPYNYTTTKDSIPTSQDILDVLSYCSMDMFVVDEQASTVTKLHSQAMLDFGGIAKGYAVDKASEKCALLSSYLINVGGEIRIGKEYKTIAIASPFDQNEYIDTLTLKETAVATSGVYERYFTYAGTKYHHVLAKDGYPAVTDLVSVTVISPSAMTCDILATCGLLMDRDSFQNLLDTYSATATLVDKDGNISRL